MNTDLDRRAREASTALKELVYQASLHPSPPIVNPTGTVLVPLLTAAFTVLAAIALMLWLILPPPFVGQPAATSNVTDSSVTTQNVSGVTSQPGVGQPEVGQPGVGQPAPEQPGDAPTVSTNTPVDITPPGLIITHPSDGAELVESTVSFAGATEPGAVVFAGQYEAEVDADGRWEIVLILQEGANRAVFRAVDAAGNESEATLTVYFVPPTTTEKTTTTTSGELGAFDANFTWGVCSIDPPYDEYYGTGQPGSEVRVESEYGSGTTVVESDGSWYVKVVFPEAPPGVPFLVTVKDQYGRQETFEFKSTVGS